MKDAVSSRYGPIAVLYEDNHLLAAVKPPNLPSQSDLSGDEDMLTLLKGYIAKKYAKAGEAYLGLVHRLDRPVGGVMVFARTSKAAARLSAQFAAHTNEKKYLAVIEGVLEQETRMEDWLLAKQGVNVRRVTQDVPGAKYAALTSTPLCVREGLTLALVTLETGRKHQIRAQHAFCGLPLWGDNRYGHGRPGMQIALWAHTLTVAHPVKRENVTFSCLPPLKGPWAKFEDALLRLQADETTQNGK